ncbi:MAG TPA: glycine cleavage system protein GcvH, partial [Thermoplasmataceae archaeon]|nr:glycine cleavage system protein GcvH [Thermoplasmatales archaeon AK]HLH86564.1 glycine cleavage system protein GcvH [Thermoplasmataceae archaeon]
MSEIPRNLKYTKTHEWFMENGDLVTVGITDFAQKQLTDIVYIELPSKGTQKKAGEPLLTIESVKSAEDVYSPVDGIVVEINSELSNKPELVNSDPYGHWMVRIKKTGKSVQALSPEEYRKHIGE